MHLAIVSGVCLSLATITVSVKGAEFSSNRDLPPLKLAASELDAILSSTHSAVDAANGPEASGLETVKVSIDGYEIEIPNFSLASSVAFPNEVFAFSYTYYQSDKPISSVTIDLGDSSRHISVSGGSADKIGALSTLLEKDLRRHATPIGGTKFRRMAGACLLMLFLTSLMISSVNYWNNRNRSALGILICSVVGFLLVLFVPWNRFVPGFVLYQRYSPFFLIRHAREIFLLCLVAALVGIPLSYFVLREKR